MTKPLSAPRFVFPWSGRLAVALCLVAAPCVAVAAPGQPAARPLATLPTPKLVEVTTPRVHLHDLGVTIAEGATDVDLGPAPPLGSTRTIDADELGRLLASGNGPSRATLKLPAQVRIVRKARHLAPSDVERIVRAAIEPTQLPKSATISAVRALAVDVPEGFDRVTSEVPPPPRRAGIFTVTSAITFHVGADIAARITVPVELTVPPESLLRDVMKGAAVMLVVRRGLVEVSMPATAAADADVGGTLPIMIKPSGRIVRARMLDRDRALSIEDQ